MCYNPSSLNNSIHFTITTAIVMFLVLNLTFFRFRIDTIDGVDVNYRLYFSIQYSFDIFDCNDPPRVSTIVIIVNYHRPSIVIIYISFPRFIGLSFIDNGGLCRY